MTNLLNQSIVHLRLTKVKNLSIMAVTALVFTATLSRADSAGNQPAQNHLAGTWISRFEPGVAAPSLVSYMSDGRVIFSRPITILPGPGSVSLVGTGHGEWVRTGNHEFASTVILLGSDLTTEFTFYVKVISAIKLDDASDQLTLTGTVTVTFADGTEFSFPSPGSGVYTRIVAGQ